MKIIFEIKIFILKIFLIKRFLSYKSNSPRSYNLAKNIKSIHYKINVNNAIELLKEDSFYNQVKKDLLNQKVFVSLNFDLLQSIKHNKLTHSILINNNLLIDKIIDKPNEYKLFKIINKFNQLPVFLNFVYPNSYKKVFNCKNYTFIKKNYKFRSISNIYYISTSTNYGHFLEEIIPSIGMFLEKIEYNFDNVIYLTDIQKYQKELLELFFPQLNYRSLNSNFNYKIKSSTLLPSLPSIFTIPWLDEYCEKKFKKNHLNKKVFCGRPDRVKNFNEIKKYLEEKNFIYLDPYKRLIDIQKILSSAEIIIFTPGAEQSNVCFANNKCKIYFLTTKLLINDYNLNKNTLPNLSRKNKKINLIYESNEFKNINIKDYGNFLSNNKLTYNINVLPL